VTLGLAALRATGIAALLLLLWNPPWLPGRTTPETPLVLLDASLSLAGTGARWPEALDSARRLAGTGGVIWRFGAGVAAFDTLPPADGASRLAPALTAAAARAGPVTVITDGEIDDLVALPPDLRARPRVVTLPRPAFADAYVAAVTGQRRLAATDTLRLGVSVGVAGGSREPGAGSRSLAVRLGDRRLASRAVILPDSGTIVVELEVPAARLPTGPAALTVALEGAADAEPRDDARVLVVETVARPAVVVLADPPDWEVRFLARTLGDVVRAPVRTYVRLHPDGGWRDGATLRPVGEAEVARALAGARLVAHRPGSPLARTARGAARLVLAPAAGEGDWYVTAPPASPIAGALAGIPRDSLPPLSGVAPGPGDSGVAVALAAALARRGRPAPVVTLRQRDGARVATVAASGFWRWGFRGGTPEVAYRALVAALADWLLGEPGAGSRERFAPVVPESPHGLPLTWRWLAAAPAADVMLRLTGPDGERRDTLRFDAAGQAELSLPPGVYRYAAVEGAERGVVAVEAYSDEWRPAAVRLAPQPGMSGGPRDRRGPRDTWWVFAFAIAAFAAEWYWRRREGLP
jgi:hypothetical protein